MHESWFNELEPFLCSEKGDEIFNQIREEKETYVVYPTALDCFNVFKMAIDDIRVVILGQDPYYTPNMATGYAFAIPEDSKKIPPSLKNIEEEIRTSHFDKYADMRYYSDEFDYSLQHWIDQGVFLLNTSLTVRRNEAGSHLKIWKSFINFVFSVLNKCELIYMLWGNHAKKYKSLIGEHNSILESPHPSPLARGFKGNNHFIQTNNILKTKENGKQITWI